MVRGVVMPERRKKAYGMTSMGTGTSEKEKQTKFRRFPTPPKRKIKNITFPIDKVGNNRYYLGV